MTNTLRVNIQNVPCQTTNDLKAWVKSITDIEWDEIENHVFYTPKIDTQKNTYNNQNKHVCLIFKNENTFRRAIDKIPSYYIIEQDNDLRRYRDSEKESWGRELVIQTPANVTVEDIINKYGADIVMKCIQLNEKSRVESFIKLNNLPNNTNEADLRQCLEVHNGLTPKYIYVGLTKNNATGWAKITFHNDEQRDQAAIIYNSQLCDNIFPITIIGKRGLKQKFVRTTVMKNDDPNIRHNHPSAFLTNIFRVTMINREVALQIFSSRTSTNLAWSTPIYYSSDTSQWTIDSTATTTIYRTDLYPTF
ncbi:unnamed protein product, partial [Rotaria socialis]